jgi:hypothetical protein
MQFVLMILRLVLGVLFPSSRDGLSLAARPDGRVEHVPRSAWDWLLGPSHDGGRPMRGRAGSAGRAPKVRADGATPGRPAGRSQGDS